MKKRSWVAAVILAVFVLGSVTTAWACKSAGPNKHVGSVTAIDAKAKTFTIRDADQCDQYNDAEQHDVHVVNRSCNGSCS